MGHAQAHTHTHTHPQWHSYIIVYESQAVGLCYITAYIHIILAATYIPNLYVTKLLHALATANLVFTQLDTL